MKRFLSAGEGYALLRTSIVLLFFFMCLHAVMAKGTDLATKGGQAVSDTLIPIRPLQIGDTIPEALWNMSLQVVNHPEGRETITLGEYRGRKLIVLDFWATYCKPCIRSLQHLQLLQEQIGADIIAVQPVLVYDRAKNIALFEAHHGAWPWASVVNDTVLNKQVFPLLLTGFGTVWIRQGRLVRGPQTKDLSYESIRSMLQQH